MAYTWIRSWELAPSNRSRCDHCRRKIPLGTPRVEVITNLERFWTRFLCYACSKEAINREIRSLKDGLKLMEKMKSRHQKNLKDKKIKEIIKKSKMLEELEK